MEHISSKIIQQIFVLLLLLLMGGLIFSEMLPYLSGILGAITIYVLMRKWMEALIKKGWQPPLAASLLMFLSFVGILIPISGIIMMLTNKIGNAVNNSVRVFDAIKEKLVMWENRLGYDLSSEIDASAISSWVSTQLKSMAGSTFNIFISVGIMYFLLYFMLTSKHLIGDSLSQMIPFSKKNSKIIGNEIRALVRSNALGIPLVGIAQGIIALIGFFVFGIEDPFFWFVIVTIGSMIPFVGTFIGILPVFILTLSTGHDFQAWGILIYGIVIVGATDNIIRLYVLKKLDNVHPLITFVGVIIGVPIFGFIGLIFGPILISLFITMWRIYIIEYNKD